MTKLCQLLKITCCVLFKAYCAKAYLIEVFILVLVVLCLVILHLFFCTTVLVLGPHYTLKQPVVPFTVTFFLTCASVSSLRFEHFLQTIKSSCETYFRLPITIFLFHGTKKSDYQIRCGILINSNRAKRSNISINCNQNRQFFITKLEDLLILIHNNGLLLVCTCNF